MEELSTAPEAEAPAPAPATPEAAAPSEPAKAVEESPRDKAEAADLQLDDDLRKVFRNANRERGEDGKFASKEPTEAPAQAVDEAKAVEPERPAEPAKPEIPPPHSWTAEAKEEWSKVPPKLQEHIAKREAESHREISKLGQFTKAMAPVHDVIEPHVERIKAAGLDVPGYLNRVLAADQWLMQDPVSAFKELAKVYNVDTQALFDPLSFSASDPQTQQLSAQLTAQRQEIDYLKQMLSDTRNRVVGREAHESQARQSRLESEVQEFSKGKPDFESLIPDMEVMIAQIKRNSPDLAERDVLTQAYERARWSNPTTRAKLLEAQTAELEKKRIEQAKQDASRAKRSAAINVNGTVPMKGAPSYDDDLRSIWRRNHAS